MGDDGAQEEDRHHSVGWGVTQSDGTGWGWTPSEAHNHLCCLYNTELQDVVVTRSPEGPSPTCGQTKGVEVRDSLADGVKHAQQWGTFCSTAGIESRAEVHRQDLCVGFCGVQVLRDKVVHLAA